MEDVTGFPELFSGRVKTLHPRVHAGILARRDLDDDMLALERFGIRPFDLVCVNLYPFTEVAARHGAREEDAVEMIDIGGPAMLRAAAKNFQHVAALSSPAQYEPVLAELRAAGGLSPSTRRFDVTEKRALYGSNGVAHLWLLDPDARTLEAFVLASGVWTLAAAFGDGAEVRAAPFEPLAFPLGALWPD